MNTHIPEGSSPENKKNSAQQYRVSNGVEGAYEIVESMVHAVIVAILLLTIFFRISIVEGTSMVPTLHDRDVLVISDFMYTPKTGDIVVLQPMTEQIKKLIIKRVIATGGQTVDIDFENWLVTVDGEPVEASIESYINYDSNNPMNQYNVTFPHTVPEGKVFVLGDNRNDSSDSRSTAVGDVDEKLIVGRALWRVIPFSDRKSLINKD